MNKNLYPPQGGGGYHPKDIGDSSARILSHFQDFLKVFERTCFGRHMKVNSEKREFLRSGLLRENHSAANIYETFLTLLNLLIFTLYQGLAP